MVPVIKATKDKIMDVVRAVTSAPPPLDGWKVRLGFIAYSDFGIEPQFEFQDFTSSTVWFLHALGKLKCKLSVLRKNDFAEDVVGGIEMATMFSWASTSRTVIHIGDAPAHGFQFHNMDAADDYYPRGDPLKRDLKKIFLNLKIDCQVRIGIACLY